MKRLVIILSMMILLGSTIQATVNSTNTYDGPFGLKNGIKLGPIERARS